MTNTEPLPKFQPPTHCPVCEVFLTDSNKLQVAAGGQVCFHR